MKYDVVVIGAGPAGSSAALMLSSLGHKVLIIDPLDKKKACAGVLTAQYIRKYGIKEIFVERELKGIRISFRGIKAEITYRQAVEYSIDRQSYDSFNLNEAITAGSEFKKDTVLSLDEKDSHVIIKTKKEHILADYAVVAAGVSDLSLSCGGIKKYAYCIQQKKDIVPGHYFEMDLLGSGYSWIVPKKECILSGTFSLWDYPDIDGERGLIPLELAKNISSSRSLLVGDAAGFVSPFEGEGLYYARRSGEIAAEIVSGTISGKNRLDDYEKYCRKEFDFHILNMLSMLLSNDRIKEAFIISIRDNERFNKLVEDILTKNSMRFKREEIFFMIKAILDSQII